MRALTALALCFGVLLPASWADARVWSSKSGHFKVEAEIIASKDNLVVLKKESGELIAVELDQLTQKTRNLSLRERQPMPPKSNSTKCKLGRAKRG